MNRNPSPMIWGIVLVALGVLFLLQTLGLGGALWTSIWALLFAAGGFTFLYFFVTDMSGRWWAVIPGMALLGIASTIAVSSIPLLERLAGGVFLGALALAFWLVYFTHREFWWAIIPGGVLTTLSVVAVIDQFVSGDVGGALFMLGLGATFILLSFVRAPQGRLTWALIPGGILTIIGLALAADAIAVVQYIWPVALILVGLFFVLRNVAVRPRE